MMDLITKLRFRGKYSMNSHGNDMQLHMEAANRIAALEKQNAELLDELRRAVCGIRVVGEIDGYGVVRRNSVLDLIEQRQPSTQEVSK